MPADRASNVLHALFVDDAARQGVARETAENLIRTPTVRPASELDPETWGLSEQAIAEQESLIDFFGARGQAG